MAAKVASENRWQDTPTLFLSAQLSICRLLYFWTFDIKILEGIGLSTPQESDYPLPRSLTIHSPAVRLSTLQRSDYPLTSIQTILSPAVRLSTHQKSDFPFTSSQTILHTPAVRLSSTHHQSEYSLKSNQTIHSPAVRLPTHQQSDYPLTSSQTIHSPAVRLSSTHQQSDFQQISRYSTVEYPLFERILLLLKSDQADQLFLWSLCPGCKNYKLSCPAYRFPITIAA